MKNSVTPLPTNILHVRGGASSSMMEDYNDQDYHQEPSSWGHNQPSWDQGPSSWGHNQPSWDQGQSSWGHNQPSWDQGQSSWGHNQPSWDQGQSSWGHNQPSWDQEQYNYDSHRVPTPSYDYLPSRSNEESNLSYLLDSMGLSHLNEEHSTQATPNWHSEYNSSRDYRDYEQGSSSSYQPEAFYSHDIRSQHDYNTASNLPYPGHFYDTRWPRLPPHIYRYIKARFDQFAIMREYNVNNMGLCLGLSCKWLEDISKNDLPSERGAINRMLQLSSYSGVHSSSDLQDKYEKIHNELAAKYRDMAANNKFENYKAALFSLIDSIKEFSKKNMNMRFKPQFGKDKFKNTSLSDADTPVLASRREGDHTNLINILTKKMSESVMGIRINLLDLDPNSHLPYQYAHAIAFSRDKDEKGIIIFDPNAGEIKVPYSELKDFNRASSLTSGFKNIHGFQLFTAKK